MIHHFSCCSWETALNFSLDVSFDNMRGWKRIQEEAGEVNSMEALQENYEISH